MTSAGPDAEDRPTPAWRLLRGRIGRRMPTDPQVAAIVRVAGLAYVLLAAINVARATTYLPAGRLLTVRVSGVPTGCAVVVRTTSDWLGARLRPRIRPKTTSW